MTHKYEWNQNAIILTPNSMCNLPDPILKSTMKPKLKQNWNLDPLQFAYKSWRGTYDALLSFI